MSNGPMNLVSTFTGPLFNPGDTLTRTFWLTPLGGCPEMLASVTGDTTMGQVSTMPVSFKAEYSITEAIGFTAVRAGDSFSIDDSVKVPEPATLGLFALGFAGLGFTRRKRRN
jgi:hypothetical protein